MKRIFKIFFIAALLITAPLLNTAQNPPHPNGGTGPNGNNHAVGSGAPIENGTFILLALSMAYAGRKLYEMRTKKEEKSV
jgi:hypothetical protein